MKKIMTAIAVVMMLFVNAKELSVKDQYVYNKIKAKLESKEITIKEAQILWIKHRNQQKSIRLYSE